MAVWLHNLIDRLLRLLPGRASDPASIEARVRRSAAAMGPIVAAAFAEQRRVVAAAFAEQRRVVESAAHDALEAAQDAWYASSEAAKRAKALEAVAQSIKKD